MSQEKFNTKDFIENMNTVALMIFKAFDSSLNVDYSLDELYLIEKEFGKRWHNTDVKAFTTYLPFGYILGETIVRNIPGSKWNYDEEINNVFDVSISVPVKTDGDEEQTYMKIYPIVRVRKFHKDREDRLTTMYWIVDMLSKYTNDELLRMGEYVEDGWYKFDDGRGGFQMLRIMSAKKPITDKIKDVPLEDRLAHIVNDDNTISKIPIESLESVTVREEKKKKAEKIEEELASHKENIRNKNNYKF